MDETIENALCVTKNMKKIVILLQMNDIVLSLQIQNCMSKALLNTFVFKTCSILRSLINFVTQLSCYRSPFNFGK